MKGIRIFSCSLIIYIAMLSFPFQSFSETEISAITSPSADVILSFTQPGRLLEVNVKEGDVVEAGQLLVQLDDAAEEAQLAHIEALSADTTQIEAAQASLSQKRIDLKMLEWAAGRSSATELEVEHARLDVTLAELSLKSAQFEHEQNKRKYKEALMRIDRMSLVSPITGRIEKAEVEVGESVNALDEVIRVVKTDPLWIDVPVPLTEGRILRLGQTVEIKFPGTQKPVKGKIIFISTVADAASATLRVRIEIPNQANRPAGEYISVIFSGKGPRM